MSVHKWDKALESPRRADKSAVAAMNRALRRSQFFGEQSLLRSSPIGWGHQVRSKLG